MVHFPHAFNDDNAGESGFNLDSPFAYGVRRRGAAALLAALDRGCVLDDQGGRNTGRKRYLRHRTPQDAS